MDLYQYGIEGLEFGLDKVTVLQADGVTQLEAVETTSPSDRRRQWKVEPLRLANGECLILDYTITYSST